MTEIKESKSSTDDQTVLRKLMQKFVIHHVSQTILAIYDDKKISSIDDSMAARLYASKVNEFWHSYNIGDVRDPLVTSGLGIAIFDKMLACNWIRGKVCLFQWLYVLGNGLIKSLGLSELASKGGNM